MFNQAHPRAYKKRRLVFSFFKKNVSVMKITVQSIGLTPHAPLEEYLDKKLNKLETFMIKLSSAKFS